MSFTRTAVRRARVNCDHNSSAIGNHRCEYPVDLVRRGNSLAAPIVPKDTGDALQALRVACASSLGGVAVCDHSGHILLANHPIAMVFGYAPDELVGRHFGILVPDATSGGGADGIFAVNGVRKDGAPVPIRVSLATIPGREALVVASVIDLADARRLEVLTAAAVSHERFLALISDLATRLAAAAVLRIDDILHDVMNEVGDALAVDRCVAYLPADTDGSATTAAWAWGRPGCPLPEDDFNALKALPWTMARARDGEPVCAATLDDLANQADRESMQVLGARSCASVPLNVHNARGALIVDTRIERPWPREVIDRLSLLAAILGQAFARTRERARPEPIPGVATRQGDQTIGRDATPWRKSTPVGSSLIAASDSAAIRSVLASIHQVAPTGATVLLLGETGVGKELFAEAIHNLGPRRQRAMIRINCAAIPTALIESELFGRERGAFTGALSRQVGRFEAASGGTIFLDEIGDLPLEIQVKLLRVLQERTIERLGSNQSTKVDVRVIAATNKNLEQAVADRTFREDLYYRLNVFPITIPPLRERIDDIAGLVWTFIDEFSQLFGKKITSISTESLAALQRYPWPGNVRELRNVIERAMIVATGPALVVAPPRHGASPGHAASSSIIDAQAKHITSVLDSCGWRIRGAGGAAERLGVKPTTLESKMARLGIVRENGNRTV